MELKTTINYQCCSTTTNYHVKKKGIISQFRTTSIPMTVVLSTRIEKEPLEIDCQEFTESDKMYDIDNNVSMNTRSITIKAVGLEFLKDKTYYENNLIDKLFKKYFHESQQKSILIIVNIFNIISMLKMYNKTILYTINYPKETSRLDYRQFKIKIKKKKMSFMLILKRVLMRQFIDVISSLNDEPEFRTVLKIFIILIIFGYIALKGYKPEKNPYAIFKKIIALLEKLLKKDLVYYHKIFPLESNFYHTSINLMTVIWNSKDLGIANNLPLSKESLMNSRMYFKEAFYAVAEFHGNKKFCLNLILRKSIFSYRTNLELIDETDFYTAKPSTSQQQVTDINQDVTFPDSDGILVLLLTAPTTTTATETSEQNYNYIGISFNNTNHLPLALEKDECFSCKKPVQMMCSLCKTAKYCSKRCIRKDQHVHNAVTVVGINDSLIIA